MNSEIDKIKELCIEHGETFASLERDLGFCNGYFARLKKGFLPPDRLEKVARHFGVTINYLRNIDVQQDLIVKAGDEEILIELFRKEKDDGILHKYIELAKAFKGDK